MSYVFQTSVDVPPPMVSVYPKEEDIGSKADRRDRKRKHTVTELFSLKRRSSPPSKPATPAAKPAVTPAKPAPATATKTPSTATKTPSTATKAPSVPTKAVASAKAAISTKAASSTKAPGSPAKAGTASSDGSPPSKRSKAKVQAPKLQSPGQEDLMLIKVRVKQFHVYYIQNLCSGCLLHCIKSSCYMR